MKILFFLGQDEINFDVFVLIIYLKKYIKSLFLSTFVIHLYLTI